MGFLYIILSLLCRLFAADRILRATGSLRYKSLRTQRDQLSCYAIRLPILGWYSVWIKESNAAGKPLEIVLIERDINGGNWLYDRPSDSGHPKRI